MNSLFNQKVQRASTGAIKWDAQPNKTDLPFWIADSDYSTAPCVVDTLKEVSTYGAYGYNMIPKAFAESVVLWYKKRYDSNVSNEWVIPSTGVILSIRILLDILTKEGEGVILQTPVYHTFHHVINNNNRIIIENKLKRINDSYEIDYDNLDALFARGHKVMILCSPHNPVGRIWSKEEISKVIEIAKKHNAFVIIDEIHSDLNISDKKFVSGVDFANIYENIAICNAPSKAFNLAGLHTSYVIIPSASLRDEFNKVCEKEFLNSPSVYGYSATISAYTNGDEWIDEQNKHIRNNYEYLRNFLNEELPSIKVTRLEGTYLVWLDLSFTKKNTEELLKTLGENGIVCSGGVQFSKDYESFVRFNIACPFDQLKEGLNRLVKTFK